MTTIQAIDAHAHYGTVVRDEVTALEREFRSGDGPYVAERARRANTELSIVSPLLGLMPRGGADAVAGNEEAAQVVADTPGLLQWVIVHPLQPKTYDQARQMLQTAECVGIKVHPEEHQYSIKEHGRAIFAFAAELGAVVLAHSGDDLSMPDDFVPFADEFADVKLIVAHLGNGGHAAGAPDLQTRAIAAAKHGNIWTDTSSARSLIPKLIEWAVREVGVERILFGTDTPVYDAPMQRARIDCADLSDQQKQLILRDNAVELLGLMVTASP